MVIPQVTYRKKSNTMGVGLAFALLVLFAVVASANFAQAADLYMSTTGTKTSGKSTSGDWSNANCYNNLRSAMAAAAGGDTITINDGTYSGTGNLIDQNNRPPSGSAGAFTTIRARNIPGQNGVATNQPLKVIFDAGGSVNAGIWITGGGSGASSYVKFYGLQFQVVNTYTGWNHLFFKQCAFLGTLDGNNEAVNIGGTYNLLEDCIAYGKGRYKFMTYDYTHSGNPTYNLLRRCIVRHDYSDDAVDNNPVAGFTSYDTVNDAFLNCIDVDSDSPTFWASSPEYDGAFYAPKNEGGANMLVQGSIVIRNAAGVGSSTGNSGVTYTDVAGINIGGGMYHKNGATLNRLTLANVNPANFKYSSGQTANNVLGQIATVYGYTGTAYANNSIFRGVTSEPVFSGAALGSYTNTYNDATIGNSASNNITTDPLVNGLLYPVRIESGSPLLTSGSSGGQRGARIVNKLGVDGTFQGDANWNTEQGSLWPWPLEDWVKAQLASMPSTITGSTMPSPTRGFASPTAKRLDGASPVTLTSYIWESLGNAIPASIYGTVTADTTAPTVSITSPTGGSVSGTVSVTANASDNVGVSRVEFYVNGALQATDTATPYLYSWNTAGLASGSYTLTAKAYDAANNVGQSGSVSVTLVNDTTAPTATLSAPANGATVSGTLSVTASATDNVGVSKIEIYENGVLKSAGNVSPFTYSWNTTAEANGSVTLTAKAYDAAGNIGQSSAVAVTINNVSADTVAPTVSIGAPTSGTTVSGTATVSATASDNVGVNKVEFYLNGALKATDTAAPYTYGWNTTTVANGAYTLTAKAYDAAGNVGTSTTISVTVNNVTADTTPPTVALSAPASGATVSGTVAVSANASDNVGVARVEFYLNGALASTVSTAPYGYNWNTTAVANGSYTLLAKAYDAAGNVGQSTIIPVTVNNTVAVAAPIAFVQVASATPQSATQTVAVTYPKAQTSGDLNVVVVGWNDTTSNVQSVTDSLGNVYTLAAGTVSGTGIRQSIYYAKGVKAGTNKVTVVFSQAATYPDIRILEYSGVGTLDKTAGTSGSGSTAGSGSVTTTAAKELIFSANTVSTGNKSAGSGFTSRVITSPDSDLAQDGIVSALGSYSPTAPLSASGYWVMQTATFK